MCVLRVLQPVMMTVGDNGGGTPNTIPDAGDGGVGICDTMTNDRNSCICIYFLEVESWRRPSPE